MKRNLDVFAFGFVGCLIFVDVEDAFFLMSVFYLKFLSGVLGVL